MRDQLTKLYALLLLTILMLAVFLLGTKPAFALVGAAPVCPPNLPLPLSCFGGPILNIIPPHFSIVFPNPLDCYGPTYVIGPPKPGNFAVISGISRVYKYFKLRYGANVLGIAFPPIPFICGTANIILKIGTSL